MSHLTLLTVREAATKLRVSRPTIYRWINTGRLKAVRYGQPHVPNAQTSHGGSLRVTITEVERELAA